MPINGYQVPISGVQISVVRLAYKEASGTRNRPPGRFANLISLPLSPPPMSPTSLLEQETKARNIAISSPTPKEERYTGLVSMDGWMDIM